jgi:hypothetical protein
MEFPLNRVVAFLGPYISVFAGGLASWLVARVDIIGIPGLDQNNLATWIASAITFVVTTLVTWLGHSKWLKGHHISMVGDARVQAAALTGGTGPANTDAVTFAAGYGGDLPTDEEEFAAPPESSFSPDSP